MSEKITATEVETTSDEVHPLVGVANGFVDANGETIVYEYDDKGEFTGWHKEAK